MANYKDYMLFDKLPHTWCSGCGHGIILQAIADALAMQELDKHNIALVSGIGCFGRVDDYLDINCRAWCDPCFHACHFFVISIDPVLI